MQEYEIDVILGAEDSVCPQCGISEELVPQSDPNQLRCKTCGWSGTKDQLVKTSPKMAAKFPGNIDGITPEQYGLIMEIAVPDCAKMWGVSEGFGSD